MVPFAVISQGADRAWGPSTTTSPIGAAGAVRCGLGRRWHHRQGHLRAAPGAGPSAARRRCRRLLGQEPGAAEVRATVVRCGDTRPRQRSLRVDYWDLETGGAVNGLHLWVAADP